MMRWPCRLPWRLFVWSWLWALAACHQALPDSTCVGKAAELRELSIPAAVMQSTVEFLSSDLLEGRAPGTRGGDLAEAYIKSLFKLWDLEPGADGKYLQPLALRGITPETLEVEANQLALVYRDDVMGAYVGEKLEYQLEAPAVFVGFGIQAELWEWDDFKGVDVRDKFLIARVNDPGLFDPGLFEGQTLTYFGRWTYHLEEAARRGAAGILLIHTDQTAGYAWQVVKNSWGNEQFYLESDTGLAPDFSGWIREEKFKEILDSKGIDLESLYKKSMSRDFTPLELGFSIRVRGKNRIRRVAAHNVVARIPGQRPEQIVISAHIDHLGKDPGRDGDNIYNGAIDNGSAVAAMLLTARELKRTQPDLHYSVIVLACHAEESGLLGSRHFVQTADRQKIIANINFESTPVWEKAASIMGVGARFSTLEDQLKLVAREQGLAFSQFSMTNQGFFFRSDQFSFAKYDIPAVWISAGEDDGSGKRRYNRYWKETYHTVDDEYHSDWDLGALEQTIRSALMLIHNLNQEKVRPAWKRKLTFPTRKDKLP